MRAEESEIFPPGKRRIYPFDNYVLYVLRRIHKFLILIRSKHDETGTS
jgi:hypothetical protein